jgi:hypothetical protein
VVDIKLLGRGSAVTLSYLCRLPDHLQLQAVPATDSNQLASMSTILRTLRNLRRVGLKVIVYSWCFRYLTNASYVGLWPSNAGTCHHESVDDSYRTESILTEDPIVYWYAH